MSTFKVIKKVMDSYLAKNIKRDCGDFICDGVVIDYCNNEQHAIKSIIEETITTLAILKRLMPLKFDVLSDGTKEVPVIIGAQYIISTVTKDTVSLIDSYDIMQSVAYMADEDGVMTLTAEEYTEVCNLIRDVAATGVYEAKSILFCIDNKRLNDDEVEEGVRHLYQILAPNDNILANFSCAGHIEGFKNMEGSTKSYYVLSTPSIMIDFADGIDMMEIIRNCISTTDEQMKNSPISKAYRHIIESSVRFEAEVFPSICRKTWKERVKLDFSPIRDGQLYYDSELLVDTYLLHGILLDYLTRICKEIAVNAVIKK